MIFLIGKTQGIEGRMFIIIRSIHDNVTCCVKHNNLFSDLFICKNSLFQGEVLSPILFSMYLNDRPMQLLSDNCPNIEIQMLNLFFNNVCCKTIEE